MSYDLVFWSQAGPLAANAETIYHRLVEGDRVEGLAELPIDSFLAAVLELFPAAVREANGDSDWIYWVAADEQAAFEVAWSPQHVLVCCRATATADINRLIDIAVAHDCRLYDPQVNERFA